MNGIIGKRKNTGTAGGLLIVAFGLCALLIVMILTVFHWQNYFLVRQRAQSACEAASLAVASELSRVVIEDPNWGCVALGDQPACGKATVAGDGEPIPIVGINSVVAAARLEALVAQEVTSFQFKELANQDAAHARSTVRRLERALTEAVSASPAKSYRDWNGQPVNAYKIGKNVFEQNVNDIRLGRARLERFTVKTGWLDKGSSTLTPRPERRRDTAKAGEDFYEAFVNVPLGEKDFYFAGIAPNSRLVNPQRFRNADGERLSSAVLVEAVLSYAKTACTPSYSIAVTAAALPQAAPDRSAAGSLVVYFPQGTVNKFPTLKSLIDADDFQRAQIQRSSSISGDFPKDPGAQLVTRTERSDWTLSSSISRAVLDWLKTNHGASRLPAVVTALDAPFQTKSRGGPNTVAIFDFDRSKNAMLSSYSRGGFYRQTVSDGQSYDIAYGVTPSPIGNLGVSVRNHVTRVSLSEGGKHAGQPLFCELPLDYDYPSSQIDEDSEVPARCRKSYIKGGLAASIELFAN